MASSQICDVCGGNKFITEAGRQSCTECGYENNLFVEVTTQDEHVMNSSVFKQGAVSLDNKVELGKQRELLAKQKMLRASSSWTTYEALSMILHDWVTILVQLGASETLPNVTLKLWAGYLAKIDIAFFNSSKMKPKADFVVNKRNRILLLEGQKFVRHSNLSSRHKTLRARQLQQEDENANRSLRKVLKRIQKRFICRKSHEVAHSASSVLSDLSVTLSDNDSRHSKSSGRCSVDDKSLKESSVDLSSAMSWTSKSTTNSFSTERSKAHVEDDSIELPVKKVRRSKCVLRWLNHNNNVYNFSDEEGETREPCMEGNYEFDANLINLNKDGRLERLSRHRNGIPSKFTNAVLLSPCKSTHNEDDESNKSEFVGGYGENTEFLSETSSDSDDSEEPDNCKDNKANYNRSGAKRKLSSKLWSKPNKKGKFGNRGTCSAKPDVPNSCWNIKWKKRMQTRSSIHNTDCRKYVYKMRWYRSVEPLMPTFPKILALLYMACRLNGEEVLLLDLLRWCRSNHLPYKTAPYMLADTFISLSRYDLEWMLQCHSVPSNQFLRKLVAKLCLLLDVQMLPLPLISSVTARLLRALCLPDDMEKSVHILADKFKEIHYPHRLEMPGIDLVVGAVIIFLLKTTWGLDGRQEKALSDQVSLVNAELERIGSSFRLFNWNKWYQHISRVLWFNRTVDPGSVIHYDRHAPLSMRYQPDRLAQYFWTHGLWRRPRTTYSIDDKLAPLLQRLLEAQHLNLDDAVSEVRLFQASYAPLLGHAQQYKHCWNADNGREDREDLRKVAESICITSFEKHCSDFLMDGGSGVRHALASLHSKLLVTVHTGDVGALPWQIMNSHFKNLPENTNLKGLVGTSRISINESATRRKNKGHNKNQCPAGSSQQTSYNTGEKAADGPEEDNGHSPGVVLSNPMENSWLLLDILSKSADIKSQQLPDSYRWLINLVARLCGATKRDLLLCCMKIEKLITGVSCSTTIS